MLLSDTDDKIHACGKMKVYRSFVRFFRIGNTVSQTEKGPRDVGGYGETALVATKRLNTLQRR